LDADYVRWTVSMGLKLTMTKAGKAILIPEHSSEVGTGEVDPGG
jgi:hypothetical protein